MEIVIALGLSLLIWLVIIYNKLVRDKNRVYQAWSDIGVQLKFRHDLIPKLVSAVDAYAHYERATLEKMTRLRVDAEQTTLPAAKAQIESALTGDIRQLIAVAESYPELKADYQYLDLMRQLSEVENQIQFARRYYNGAVRNLNIRVDSFPDLFMARIFGFQPADFFDFDGAQQNGRSES